MWERGGYSMTWPLIPEQIISLSLARWIAGVGPEGELQGLVRFAAVTNHHLGPSRSTYFPVIAASGFWVLGVAVVAV
jgi:hypothetical protein